MLMIILIANSGIANQVRGNFDWLFGLFMQTQSNTDIHQTQILTFSKHKYEKLINSNAYFQQTQMWNISQRNV